MTSFKLAGVAPVSVTCSQGMTQLLGGMKVMYCHVRCMYLYRLHSDRERRSFWYEASYFWLDLLPNCHPFFYHWSRPSWWLSHQHTMYISGHHCRGKIRVLAATSNYCLLLILVLCRGGGVRGRNQRCSHHMPLAHVKTSNSEIMWFIVLRKVVWMFEKLHNMGVSIFR